MVADELRVVEGCVVGCEEEDAGGEEFVVDAFALGGFSIELCILLERLRTFNFSAACGPWPRSTSIWRVLGWRRRALAIHRRASCDATVVSPSNAWRPSVRRPCNGHYAVPSAPNKV